METCQRGALVCKQSFKQILVLLLAAFRVRSKKSESKFETDSDTDRVQAPRHKDVTQEGTRNEERGRMEAGRSD